LQVTTQALDEAAERVSRYLLAQLAVNVTYGICIAIGLYFIGVPNALLWGMLAAILRFVPYVGAWIAASFPILLAVAISPAWTMPLLTFALFLSVELLAANALEPWLYGSSTGLSPIAIIASAAFWTWLWGGIGLLLAIPLTVCIVVLGKYIPALAFIDVLLGDKPPIAPEDRLYQRFLATDEDEVAEIVDNYIDKHSLAAAFEDLIVPTLRLIDEDLLSGTLNEADRARVLQDVRALIADLDETHAPPAPPAGSTPANDTPAVICIPARDLGDEIGCVMLARLLAEGGVSSRIIPSKLLASEMVEEVARSSTRQLCISVVPPGSTRQATYLCKKLRERFPEARITIGMWGETPSDDRRVRRVRTAQIDVAFTSLQEAARELVGAASVREIPKPAAEAPLAHA
jgi:AI-2E family transporter